MAKSLDGKKNGGGKMKYIKQREYVDRKRKKMRDRLRWLIKKDKEKKLSRSEREEIKMLEAALIR